MWWLAGAGLSALSGAAGASSANAQAAAQARQQVEQMQQQVEANQAGLEANLKNLTRTNAKAGLVRLQAGLSARTTAGSISDIGIQELSAQGEASAAAGATGTVGASVQAVASDITRQAEQAKLYAQQDENIRQMNFETQIDDLYNNLDNNLYTPKVDTVQKFKSQSALSGALGGLINFGISYAGNYALKSMQLGLGNAATSNYVTAGSAFQSTGISNGTLGAFLNR